LRDGRRDPREEARDAVCHSLIEGTRRNASHSRAAALLKKRTPTNLYNEHPAWLDDAHRGLGAATAGFANIANEDARSPPRAQVVS
jgi:hypothetical protein